MSRTDVESGRVSTRTPRGNRRAAPQQPEQEEVAAEEQAPQPDPEPAEAKESDPQEIVELPRREGRVWHPAEVDRSERQIRGLVGEADGDAGGRVWRIGDASFEYYNGFPERAKGAAKFVPYATRALGLTKQELSEYLIIRHRVPNAEVASTYGRARMTVALRIMKRLGIETFEALAERDLPLSNGATCRFPATVPQLRDALRLLKAKPAAKVSRKLQAKVARYDEALTLGRRQDTDLANVRGRFVPDGGEVKFEPAGRLTTAQLVALGRLAARLADEE